MTQFAGFAQRSQVIQAIMVMRQQVWIDRHVQGVLVGRVLLYWSGILVYFGLSTGGFNWWQNPEWTLTEHLWGLFEQIGPCLPTILLLLPLVIFDIVRLSNRFAGPVYRLRKHLTELNQDSQVTPLNFRDEDYWQQLAEPINLLQQKVLFLEQQIQTLSFVHKSLSEGTLPTETESLAEPEATAAVAGGEFVRSAQAGEDMPPIPPLPSTIPETFVTVDAN